MKIILCFILFIAPIAANASGSRNLHISIEKISKLREISPSDLTPKISYLGSTEHWHIFSKTDTYLSKGYPNDHPFGLKIKLEQLVVENSWTLDVNKQNYLFNTTRCPASYLIKKKMLSKMVVSIKSKQSCIDSVQER